MIEREKERRKYVRPRRRIVRKTKTTMAQRQVDKMVESNCNLTVEQQQILEIARMAEIEEQEALVRGEAERKAGLKKKFVNSLESLCNELGLGGITGTAELFDHMIEKKERREDANIWTCYSDVSEDEGGYHPMTMSKRKRASLPTMSAAMKSKCTAVQEEGKGPVAGPSNKRGEEMDMGETGVTEREKANMMRKAMLAGPPREDMKKRIHLPNIIKPKVVIVEDKNKKNGNNTQTVSEEEGRPTMKTMKGRIKVHQMDTQRIAKILDEKKFPVNMRLAKDGSTMMACEAEHRLDVIKVLKDNGQHGHSYMTKEDRFEVRMLKGIDSSFGPERIKNEILEKLKDKGVKNDEFHVDRFETYHSVTNNIPYHMYVVKAENVETINLITSIFGVCNMVCKWERMKKRDVTQCFNCYEFGHSQRGGCFNKRRCKRCLVVEPNHECEVELETPSEENGWNPYVNVQCCGCKKFGHPPTHSKCEKYNEAITKARMAKQVKNEKRWEKSKLNNEYVPAPEPANNVWAQRSKEWHKKGVESDMPSRHQQTPGTQGVNLEEEIRRVLGIDVNDLQRLALDFIEQYKTKKTNRERGALLGLYYLQINGWTPE